MRSGVKGLVIGIILATALSVSGQGPSPAQIQAAFRQAGLSGPGIYTDSQVPTWDSASGMFLPGNGGGGGGAPSDAEYWVGAANGSLSAERNLGALGTALVINTAGVPSAFTSQTCTNQVITALSAVGTATCTTVALGTYTSGNYTASVAGTTDRISIAGAVGVGQAAVADIASTYIGQTSLTTLGTIATGVWNATTIAFGNGGTGLTTAADDTTLISSGSAWVATAVTNCTDTGGNHLNYTASTNSFSCGTTGGAATFTDNLTFTTGNALIEQNTSDGSDTRSITINAGGGAGDSSRGGAIVSYGNENGTIPGGIGIYPGNVSGSAFKVLTSDGMTAAINLLGSTGVATFSAVPVFSSGLGAPSFTTPSIGAATGTSLVLSSTVQSTAYIGGSGTNTYFRASTADGSDNSLQGIVGGGLNGTTRGAEVYAYGNEAANPGFILLNIGNVTGSFLRIVDGAGNAALTVAGADGAIVSNAIYSATDGSAANVYIDATGKLKRSTSSARYKTNITPMDGWQWLLDVTPITFNSKDSSNTRTYGGLLAEDVAEHGPKGLDGLPLYAGLDAQGRPDDVAYSQLAAPIIKAIQELNERIVALEAR